MNLRNKIADERRCAQGDTDNIGPHINATFIWSNSVAHRIAKLAPKTKEELKEVSGLSVHQIKTYGERIIATINDELDVYTLKKTEIQAEKRKSGDSFDSMNKKPRNT